MKTSITTILFFAAATVIASTDPSTCPLHAEHMKKASAANGDAKHGAEVDQRHDTLVSSHETTRHSFRLFKDGGAIELTANDASDKARIANVRTHLRDIASQFQKKNFATPAFVHDKRPDGIADMERLHASISFRYEDLDGGGRIRMKTSNAQALAAIHEFMKFQVIEHRTGDSGRIEADKR